jgi:hypothetical protein
MTIQEYQVWLKDVEAKLKADINDAVKVAQEKTLNAYVENSPVQTGFFQSSWFSSENYIDNSAPYAESVVWQVFKEVNAEEILKEELKKIKIDNVNVEVK